MNSQKCASSIYYTINPRRGDSILSKIQVSVVSVFLLSTLLYGQNVLEKPHAQQVAQFGNVEIDQEGGFTGYPRDLVPRNALRDPSHVVFGYHPYWNGTAWENYVYDLLSHVAWFGLNMGNNGEITNAHGWPVNSLVDLAHSRGVKVIVTVTNFDNSGIATLLGNANYRQAAIDNLISRVIEGNADGVNIDFEFVPSSATENFNTFIHDLTQAFHDQIPGSEVSIAMPSVDWSNAYDYNYLSDHCDGLMIMAYGYYWAGSSHAGPNSPLYSGLSSWHISRTLEDYLTKTGQDGSQLILGLPWYGRDWQVTSSAMNASVVLDTLGEIIPGISIFYPTAEANAQSYGKQYHTGVAAAWYNYNDGDQHQVWYDDSLSLVTKYQYAVDQDIKGIGIWALGYDGGRPEIWGGLSDIFGANAAPQTPRYFTVKNEGNGDVAVHCAYTPFTDYYKVYTSTDGEVFTLTDSSETQDILLTNLDAGQLVYVKVRNSNTYGSSNLSEVLGVTVSSQNESTVLVVQGFERTSGTVNNFDYIIEHGSAIQASGRLFDAASNDAVEANAIDLSEYAIVDWISGEEATSTVSFSSIEQARIKTYLEQGGRIFVSGSEIGYDLEGAGSAGDISFYHNYFKADYISDDAQSYAMNGMASGIFSGLSGVTFDNGFHGTYDVDYPDGIKPYGGSLNSLRYEGTDYSSQGGAGIQYLGSFGESTALGGIVYLGVGFEAIYPESSRNTIMAAVLDYLEISVDINPPTQHPNDFQVSQAYPNPFNGSFALDVTLPEASLLTLTLYNLKGQLVRSMDQEVNPGSNHITFAGLNNSMVSSGVYILRIENGAQFYTQRITYLK
ncbi:MAG: T9SS type A sorting domain-containing protein [FCB group bacterium]|nr:T9SS type A sorting domain-containing protein [FCB group bacterium]MBL7026814.1 T9SS type A sorting domain-containing protein [Candidatus Neomarinimicrobiota bacterium]MBL7121391.1 T9SS type A sorting domain-containing protein [Candidatus Neomarinimicrobiota bacterium]